MSHHQLLQVDYIVDSKKKHSAPER